MRILSYSETEQQLSQLTTFINTLDGSSCHIPFHGQNGNDVFHSFIEELQDKDIVVFASLIGLFIGSAPFLMFVRFCRRHEIRIISVQDEIDTDDLIFALPSSSKWMSILCSFKTVHKVEHADIQSELLGNNKHDKMLRRHGIVVNLYTAGYSISDILRMTGYKAKTHIYRILKRYGVELAYPSMQRKK